MKAVLCLSLFNLPLPSCKVQSSVRWPLPQLVDHIINPQHWLGVGETLFNRRYSMKATVFLFHEYDSGGPFTPWWLSNPLLEHFLQLFLYTFATICMEGVWQDKLCPYQSYALSTVSDLADCIVPGQIWIGVAVAVFADHCLTTVSEVIWVGGIVDLKFS